MNEIITDSAQLLTASNVLFDAVVSLTTPSDPFVNASYRPYWLEHRYIVGIIKTERWEGCLDSDGGRLLDEPSSPATSTSEESLELLSSITHICSSLQKEKMGKFWWIAGCKAAGVEPPSLSASRCSLGNGLAERILKLRRAHHVLGLCESKSRERRKSLTCRYSLVADTPPEVSFVAVENLPNYKS
jgi:hypothetical protein